jgi:L-ascorbate metabolism protein UlaG (beta-lactamase superfamily)
MQATMEIKYFGHSTFCIKGKTVTLVTDPFSPKATGLKFPKHVSADVITVSHDHEDHNDVSQIEGTPFIIKGPGEYDIKGVSIVGFPSYHDSVKGQERGKNIIFRIEFEGVNILHLGDLGYMPSTDEIEALDGVDILMIPVGGKFTIDATQAKTLITEIDPSIVIPMHYARPDLDMKTFEGCADLTGFLKEMGKEGTVPVPKLNITKDKLHEELQLVVFE